MNRAPLGRLDPPATEGAGADPCGDALGSRRGLEARAGSARAGSARAGSARAGSARAGGLARTSASDRGGGPFLGTDPLARWVALVPTWNEEGSIAALVERLLEPRRTPGGDPLGFDRGGTLLDAVPDRVDGVVVADGGSRDRTVEAARSAGATVVLGERGRGSQLRAAGRTPEARAAEVLLVLHADCHPRPGALASLRRAYRDPHLHWGAMEQRIDAEGWFYRWIERASAARVRRRQLVFGDCGLSLRRSLYDRVGGFAPEPIFEDVELSGRLGLLGPPRLIPGAELEVSARRWRGEGALRCTLRNWMLRTAFRWGASAQLLSRFYPAQDPDRIH